MGKHELDPDSDEAWARFVRSIGPPLSAEEQATVFRPNVGYRVLYVVCFLTFATVIAANKLNAWGTSSRSGPELWATIPIFGVACWRSGFVQRVYFDGSDLVVINVIRRYRIPLAAIVVGSCLSGRFGTRIGYRRPGRTRPAYVTAAAAATSPVDRTFAKQHAEDFANLVDRAAAHAQHLS